MEEKKVNFVAYILGTVLLLSLAYNAHQYFNPQIVKEVEQVQTCEAFITEGTNFQKLCDQETCIYKCYGGENSASHCFMWTSNSSDLNPESLYGGKLKAFYYVSTEDVVSVVMNYNFTSFEVPENNRSAVENNSAEKSESELEQVPLAFD